MSSLTSTENEAAETCNAIRDLLRDRGWRDAKISHYRWYDVNGNLACDTAVEVGYVYRECTVRFNQLKGDVDQGTYLTMRGHGPEFVARVKTALKSLE